MPILKITRNNKIVSAEAMGKLYGAQEQEYDQFCQEKWEQQWQLRFQDLANFNRTNYEDTEAISKNLDQIQVGFTDTGKKEDLSSNQLDPTYGINKEHDALTKNNFGQKWLMRYGELLDFAKKHGHCNVPKRYPLNLPLGHWVSFQRIQYKKLLSGQPSYLNSSRIEYLVRAGFAWSSNNLNENLWQQRYKELLKFREEHGHCSVPKRYAQNSQLGRWVSTQRNEHKKYLDKRPTHLTAKRIQQLTDIGFKWTTNSLNDASWMKRFQELITFRRKHLHCNVPHNFPQCRQLGRWVSTQRREYKKLQQGKPSQLSKERVSLLLSIGFQWTMREDTSWAVRFKQLVEFKEKYGHCNVPRNCDENKSLGQWVYSQRLMRKKGDGGSNYNPQRIEVLESIGFRW